MYFHRYLTITITNFHFLEMRAYIQEMMHFAEMYEIKTNYSPNQFYFTRGFKNQYMKFSFNKIHEPIPQAIYEILFVFINKLKK